MPFKSLRKIKTLIGRVHFFAVALALIFSAGHARAAEDIPPPFGFKWNDSMTRIEQVLVGAKGWSRFQKQISKSLTELLPSH